jgi:excisionase family DNA binding protein
MSLEDTYISAPEAAKEIGISHVHVTRLLNNGTLKGAKIGRNWIVSKTSMEKLIKERRNSLRAIEDETTE